MTVDPSKLTVLVTGATAGFGEATARRFAAAGARLIITGRRVKRLARMLKELKVPVHAIAADIRDRAEMEASLNGLPPEFAEVDVLVNNAGLALGVSPAHQSSLDDWEAMVDTNIKGLLYCTRLLLPGMVARGRGHVVNIGSVAGNYAYPGGNVYGGTKAFTNHFSRHLRADLLGTGVRVTSIEPGLSETEFSVVRFDGDAKKARQVYRGTQPITGDDIAEAVFWVSTLPAHVTVTHLEVMATCQAIGPFAIHRDEGA
jgi:3-hydroxy acid dehydrogenase / malonic semialdehyde reductase